MKNKKAFTVIELLMVIAIMGILLAVITLNFFNLQNQGKFAKTTADLRVVKIAIEAYAVKHNDFPATLPDVLLDGTVLTILPTDSYNPSDYFHYYLSPDHKYYALWSPGENGLTNNILIWNGSTPVPYDSDDIGCTNGSPPNSNWN